MSKLNLVLHIILGLLFCVVVSAIGTQVENGNIPLWAAIIIAILIVK